MHPSLFLSIGAACLLFAIAITLLVVLRRSLWAADRISSEIQLLGQMYRERTDLERQNLTWMQDQLQIQKQVIAALQEQLHSMHQSMSHAARPLLSATVEKVERQRYTLRIRNEGLGPALAISYAIKDINLKTFDVNSQLDHEFLGVGATGLLQLNMLGLPLPHEFLVLRYSSMAGEQCETHLSWKKGMLSSEYRISKTKTEPIPAEVFVKESLPAERELAG